MAGRDVFSMLKKSINNAWGENTLMDKLITRTRCLETLSPAHTHSFFLLKQTTSSLSKCRLWSSKIPLQRANTPNLTLTSALCNSPLVYHQVLQELNVGQRSVWSGSPGAKMSIWFSDADFEPHAALLKQLGGEKVYITVYIILNTVVDCEKWLRVEIQ